ncbi:MAG: 30S ribosomal protein S20 [Desulfomonilaceae bacterium]|nr:30S ribosomal protein S20 [Desulfomonilaceae bacterium]
MANHPSALKRMRQNELRRIRNMSFRSKVKTAVKRFLRATESKSEDAETLLRSATALLHRGVSKGIFHKNTASRTVSRLSKRLPSA